MKEHGSLSFGVAEIHDKLRIIAHVIKNRGKKNSHVSKLFE